MPIFEYRCKSCGSLSEYLELAGTPSEAKCKACGNNKVEKVFSTFGVKTIGDAPCESGACNMNTCKVPSCPSGTCPMSS